MVVPVEKNLAIGADIGGSHITCAAVDMTTHQILDNTYASEDVDNQAPAATIIRSWCEAIQQTLGKAGIEMPAGIGLGVECDRALAPIRDLPHEGDTDISLGQPGDRRATHGIRDVGGHDLDDVGTPVGQDRRGGGREGVHRCFDDTDIG